MRIQFLILGLVLFLSFNMCGQEKGAEYGQPLNILVFSKTAGFRHASISSGLKMLYDLSKDQKWIITATEDPSFFNEEILPKFDIAIFLNPTGDALNESQQAAFEKFMNGGKGFVGIHAAADFEYEWPYYGELVGAWFKTHPPAQEATVIFESFNHPAMKPFEGRKSYTTHDEWYSFKKNPRDNANVLARLDESTVTKYKNDNWRMEDHPVIWWQDKDGVRSFYTVFGHTHEAFQDENVIEHIKNAVNWAGRRID